MTPLAAATTLTALRDAVTKHCSQDEIRGLCFDLGLDYEIVVADKSTKLIAAQLLVQYLAARDRHGELVDWLHNHYPNADLTALSEAVATTQAQSQQYAQLAVLYAAPLIYEHGAQRQPIALLDFAGERALLSESLHQARRAITWRCTSATPDHLQTALTLGCRMLHLTGHGDPNFLAFEGEAGLAHPLSEADLREMVQAAPAPPQVAFVSACHSHNLGQALAAAGVPHVVAIRTEEAVLDNAAMLFARAFYRALLSGQTVAQAFEAGRVAVHTDPTLTRWQVEGDERDKFLLLPEGGDHSAAPFAAMPIGPPWDLTTEAPRLGEWPPRDVFVGRSDDMQQAVQGVLGERLITLVGPAGIGKTTLAIKVAEYALPRGDFADGAAFVSLRGIEKAEGIRAVIALALDVRAETDAALLQHLKDKHLLLVLDNAEDALSADGGAVRNLLERLLSASGVRVLMTSRIPPMTPRGVRARTVELRQLAAPDAGRLLVRLAPQILVNGAWPREADVLLSYLSGHPFAIELAARQVAWQGLAQVLRQIAHEKTRALRDPMLRGEGIERDGQVSMIAALNVSRAHAQTMHPEADRLFGLFGLLPGGADPRHLNEIWGDDGAVTGREGWREPLQALLDTSLVQREERGRYTTFPFVTDYAEARCLQVEDRAVWSPKITAWLAGFCNAVMDGLREGNTITFGQAAAFLRDELPSISAALLRNDASQVGDLGSTAAQLLMLTYRSTAGLDIADKALTASRERGDRSGEANTLKALGDLRLRVADLAGARAAYDEALPLFRAIDAKLGEANTLNGIGNLLRMEEKFEAAFGHYHQALNIHTQIQNQLGVASALIQMGRTAHAAKAHHQAVSLAEQALQIYRGIGNDAFDEALAIEDQGNALLELGEQDAAIAAWWQARELFRAISDEGNASRLDDVFANVAQHLGDDWPALEAQLREGAEAMRAAAVAKLAAQQAAGAAAPDEPDAA